MTAINLPISCAEVYWCIADFQSLNSTDIAQKTGLTKSTVQRHLRTLEKTGAVKNQGRPKQYCISKNVASEMLEWLKKFKELARMTPGLRYEELSQLTSQETEMQLDSMTTPVAECNHAVQDSNPWRILSREEIRDIFSSVIDTAMVYPPNSIPNYSESSACLSYIDGQAFSISDRSHLIAATTVLKEIAQVSLEVVGNAPKGEDYKGFLLLPALSEHGWRCDFSMPDGSFRQGSNRHSFPEQALAWGREVIDTGRVNIRDNQQRSFADEPLVVRPFLSLLNSTFEQYFSNQDRRTLLLAAYLMLQFGNQGQTSFWDDFLAQTIQIKPRQLTRYLNELSKLGILRYYKPPNRKCPTSYYLGPAWLSVKEVSLTEMELEAIEDGEMHLEDGYLWGIPFGERKSQNERTLQQINDVIVRVPEELGEPIWHSIWKNGEWTHQRKADENSELEPPLEKRIAKAELHTALSLVAARRGETYVGHLLNPWLCEKDNKLIWCCDIHLASGKRFHGSGKSFDSIDEAVNWAKRVIDEADSSLNNEEQGLVGSSNAALSYLMPSADSMLEKYLPSAAHSHSLVLKYLLKQFQNQGTDTFWDYFVARRFALTSQKFLNICRDLAKSGLIRYSRRSSAHMVEFCLGPAWLSLEGVVLQEQELQAIVRGEQVANYCPWRKSNESYPGENYGFPCIEQTERNIGYFYQRLGMSAKWILRQEGNILVRIPLNSYYPTWYSTWQDGFWIHKSKNLAKK